MNSSNEGAQINPAALGWAAFLLPLFAANLAYLISAQAGLVPGCFPYFDGCTSISRAAREGAALPIFRALMLPSAVLMALFWWLNAEWLRQLAPACVRRRVAVLVLGVLASVFLALYISYLGVDGEQARWLRRYGINLYFSFSVLATMLLTSLLHGLDSVPALTRRTLTGLCFILLGLGLASLPLQALVIDRDALLNAIEWSYALLMTLCFPFTVHAWNASGLRLRVQLWNSARIADSNPNSPENPP